MTNTWYYTADGKSRQGPFSQEQMQQLARSGELQPAYMARHEGAARWAPAGTFQELFPAPPVLSAAPIAQQSAAPAAAVMPPPVAAKNPDALFDFEEGDAEPRAAPTPRRRREEPSLVTKVWPAVLAVWSVPVATWREARRRVRLLELRRRQKRQEREKDQFVVEEGIRLLSAGVVVPGCEEFSKQYQQLSHAQQLAHQQGVAGNKEKRKEAARLESDLRLLYADFGQKALASDVAFAGRERDLARQQQIDTGLAQTREQIDSRVREWDAAPPAARRRVMIGSAGAAVAALLVLGCVWLALPSASEPVRHADPVAVVEKKETAKAVQPPPPAQPKTKEELFVLLSPAVPLVETVDSGSGSGFLINDKGHYYVVTNRHVVENATSGLVVHFPLKDTRLTVPSNDAKVVKIHRAADLALIDVSKWKDSIDRMKIKPVTLAGPDHLPRVGQQVIAIGHPGGGTTVLTSTLSSGDVSGVGREMEGARYLQTTTPINPGNSGGPLFDMEGRVVGVNTFTYRGHAGSDIAREGLNFALEVAFIHDLLKNPGSSLDAKAIAKIVSPPPIEATEAMKKALQVKLEQFAKEGLMPPAEGKGTLVFKLGAGEQRVLPLVCQQGEYAVAAVSEVKALDLRVVNLMGGEGWRSKGSRPDPEVKFKTEKEGLYLVFIRNTTGKEGLVSITRFTK